jgi:hypothetical protein
VGVAPRALVLVALGVLSLVALRELASAASPTATIAPALAVADPEAPFLAEAFARAYLTWDPRRPDLRTRALAPLAAPALGDGTGLLPPNVGAPQHVLVLGPGPRRALSNRSDGEDSASPAPRHSTA